MVALLAGLPLGLAAGRWAWTLLARELGVVAMPVIPPALLLVGAVVGTLVVANVVATIPARLATRVRPAMVLRAE